MRVWQVVEARWEADLTPATRELLEGYAAGLNHYAALPYYLSGGLTVFGFSPILAIQATQTLGFMLSALTMTA